MEIVNKYIQDNKLIIAFDAAIGSVPVSVGIDNAETYLENNESGKHDYWYETVTPVDKTIYVDIDSHASALLIVTVTVNNQKYVTMFLNRYMLFKAQNEHLASRGCNTCGNKCQDCDEKRWRTDTIAVLLRTQLLNYAYDNSLLYDAIQFYNDLTRVLNFKNIVFESIPQFYNNLDIYATTLL